MKEYNKTKHRLGSSQKYHWGIHVKNTRQLKSTILNKNTDWDVLIQQ